MIQKEGPREKIVVLRLIISHFTDTLLETAQTAFRNIRIPQHESKDGVCLFVLLVQKS